MIVRELFEDRPVRLAWMRGQARSEPAVGQHVVAVACELADRIERWLGYGVAEARRDNAAGWTVRLLTLGFAV